MVTSHTYGFPKGECLSLPNGAPEKLFLVAAIGWVDYTSRVIELQALDIHAKTNHPN